MRKGVQNWNYHILNLPEWGIDEFDTCSTLYSHSLAVGWVTPYSRLCTLSSPSPQRWRSHKGK